MKRLVFLLAAVLLIMTVVVSCSDVSGIQTGLPESEPKKETATAETETDEEKVKTTEEIPAETEERTPEIIKGVWISTVFNIDFPSVPGLGEKSLSAELDAIIENAKSAGLNTVFFQVRPASDALYDSDIFPTSLYLASKQGMVLPEGFDPLAYIIEKAHAEGIAVHAWINPYRVTASKDADLSLLSDDNPAVVHPEWTVEYDGKLYYNPGIPEVRELVRDGIVEIAEKYDVDGIHMDDYFYPYPVVADIDGEIDTLPFDDADEYAEYNPDSLTLDDWRRENVNILVKDCYDAIKKTDPKIMFGISPFGIWANSSHNSEGSQTAGLESYYDIYCDPLAWAKGGYVDYICPQIYWSFDNSVAPYGKLCDWWSEKIGKTSAKLLIGHAAYRVNEFSGSDEIVKQLEYASEKPSYAGSVFFGYEQIRDDTEGLRTALGDYFG